MREKTCESSQLKNMKQIKKIQHNDVQFQNNYENCPTCGGTGQIKSLSSLAISLLRIIEEEAMNAEEKQTVYLPVRLATFLLNEKKETIQNIIDFFDEKLEKSKTVKL